jgi:hypothetical protein
MSVSRMVLIHTLNGVNLVIGLAEMLTTRAGPVGNVMLVSGGGDGAIRSAKIATTDAKTAGPLGDGTGRAY